MKKIFFILFFMIIIAKAFPDENKEDEKKFRISADYEIASAELGCDFIHDGTPKSYLKFNLFNLHFLSNVYGYIFDFEITPVIILKNWDAPFNFSFVNSKIGFIAYMFPLSIKPFFGINYINLKEGIFDFNTLNFQAGIRFGILPYHNVRNLFYLETGLAEKNNKDSFYFLIGFSPFWLMY